MRTAQQLYEGVDIGGETVGLDHLHAHGLHQPRQRSAARDPRLHRQALQRRTICPRTRCTTAANPRTLRRRTRASGRLRSPRTPDQVRAHLTPDQARLYEMIWKRTLACQMTPARFDTTSVDISVGAQGHAVSRQRANVGVSRLHCRLQRRRGRLHRGGRREAAAARGGRDRYRSTACSASSTSRSLRRATPRPAW